MIAAYSACAWSIFIHHLSNVLMVRKLNARLYGQGYAQQAKGIFPGGWGRGGELSEAEGTVLCELQK